MRGSSDPTPGPTSVHLRPASLVLAVLGTVLAAAGFGLRIPALLFLALPMLVAPLSALVTLPAAPSGLRLSWRSDGSGAEVQIDGALEGLDPASARSVFLDFTRPEPIREARPPEIAPTDGSHGTRFRLHWEAPYPLIAVIPVPSVSIREPLDLAERSVPVDGTELRVERFPPEAARIGRIPLRRTTGLPGEVASRALGPSGDFFGVRYAGPGDAPRQFNWRATGRTGRQCVNEFRMDRTGDLVIVLDARPTGLGSAEDRILLAIGRAAAHGIAAGLLKEKDRVGVAVFGEYLDAVPLGAGRTHRYRIDQLLDRARIAETAGPAERLAVSLLRVYPPGVSVLLVSPLAEDESFHLLPHLRRRNFTAYALSPSPIPLLQRSLSGTPEDRGIERLMRLTRRARVSRAWQEAPVLDWEEYWSLAGLAGLLRIPGSAGGRR